MAKRKLVLVEWVDSCSDRDSGWRPLDEIASDPEPVYCRSVGWIAAQDRIGLVLVPHISGEANRDARIYASGEITIPRRAILKIKILRGG